ncbi:ArsR family transcriptional regulator [Variovorax sp. VNK109]|uniref:VpaChn25_0724 family phage protein n=1 Tax=Variovorax sp. VNK109 TaxID=3400919 RepID=UPI003BFCB2B0
MSFLTAVTEDRRLSLLLVLCETPGYTANAFLLRDAIDQIYGHSASIDQVRTDIAWLAEQGLVTSRTTGDVVLACATPRGVDVAGGRAHVPGVKRPLP